MSRKTCVEIEKKEIVMDCEKKLTLILKKTVSRHYKIECFLNGILLKPSERIAGRKIADEKWKNLIDGLEKNAS